MPTSLESLNQSITAMLRSWRTGPFLVGIAALMTLRFDRLPQWDEGVFLGQVGGIDGLDAPPAFLGPSREIGSVWYQQLLQSLVANYPNLRALHILVSLLLLAFAMHRLAEAVRVPVALLTVAVGSYWITLLYLGNFQRFALVTFLLLGGIGSYLRLAASEEPRPIDAVETAIWYSLALLMGPFEAAVVLAATLFHAIAVKMHRRSRGVLAAAVVTAFAVFVLPFLLDTYVRYGSIAERIRRLAGLQESPLNTSRWDGTAFLDYLDLAFRGPVSNAPFAPSDTLTMLLLPTSTALLLIGLYAGVEGVVRRLRRQPVRPEYLLLPLAFSLLMFLLGGFYDEVSDRYWILPASLLLVLGTARSVEFARAARALRTPAPSCGASLRISASLLVVLALLLPNAVLVYEIDANRTRDKQSISTLVLARAAIDGVPCSGVARYNTPSVRWATGCSVQQVRSIESAIEWASDTARQHETSLVYWNRDDITAEVALRLQNEGFVPLLRQDVDGLQDQVFLRP